MADSPSDTSRSLKKAEAKIDALGLPLPEKPESGEDDPKWPRNIADLSPDELAYHLTWWSGWSSYARHHLARAQTDFAAFKRDLKLETDTRVFKSVGDYKTVTECKASIAQRPDMIRMAIREQEAEAMVTMMKSLLEGYEDKYATTSREISRRGLDFHHSVTDEGRDRWNA